MTTQDRPYTVVKAHQSFDRARVKAEGRFLGSYCFRGDADDINKPLEEGEHVYHIETDDTEAMNVYAWKGTL